jgi:hypothetical protein
LDKGHGSCGLTASRRAVWWKIVEVVKYNMRESMISFSISKADGDEENRLLDCERKRKKEWIGTFFFPLFKAWIFKLRPRTKKEREGVLREPFRLLLLFSFSERGDKSVYIYCGGRSLTKRRIRPKEEGKKKGKRNGPCHTYLVKRGGQW